MKSGIYQIMNQINGNRYIGSARNLRKRWQDHLGRLCNGGHRNQHLQHAFDRYGESAFAFSILEHVEDASQLIAREQYYLDSISPEYNISPTAGNTLGFRHSPETCAKMRMAWTPERRQAHGDRNRGKRLSKETCAKMSKAMSGQGHPMYGKHHSEQTRARISQARRGKAHPHRAHRHSAETRAKISAAHMGQPCSAETRAKISRSQGQRYQRLYAQRNAEMVALHQQGIPKREIAVRFGLSRSSISRAIKRHREKMIGRA